MAQLFTASDYAKIHSLVFRDDYPGYKPNVAESPNGDGKLDTEKRYAHVSEKSLELFLDSSQVTVPEYKGDTASSFGHRLEMEFARRKRIHDELNSYLDKAHQLALEVAIAIGVPRPFWPVQKYSALRVLEYNGEAVTNPHKDFDLFTLMCYRNDESCFKYLPEKPSFSVTGYSNEYRDWCLAKLASKKSIRAAQQLNSQVHFGEILEEINPKQWLATPHEVVASGGPWQYSIVHFAIPDHEAVLPSGIDVAEWLRRRMERSRYEL